MSTAIEQIQALIASGTPEVEAIDTVCAEWGANDFERLVLTNCVANLKAHERNKTPEMVKG